MFVLLLEFSDLLLFHFYLTFSFELFVYITP